MIGQAVPQPLQTIGLETGLEPNLELLIDTAWSLRHSDVAKALELSKETLERSLFSADSKGIAYSLLTQSFCYFRLSDYKKALELGQEALLLFEKLWDDVGKQRVLNTIGIVYAESGDLMGAIKTFLQVQKLCHTLGDLKAEADALNNLAIVYGYVGDHTSSLESYMQSLSLAGQIGSRQAEMKALLNIATLYLDQAKPSEALEYLQQCLLLRSKEDPHTYALALSNFARAYAALEEYPQALVYGLEGLALMEQLEDLASASYVLDALGHIYVQLGDFTAARAHLERSLHVKCQVGDPKGQAETKLLLAKLFELQDAKDEALKVLHDALQIASEIGASTEIYKSHQSLAHLYESKGDYEQAFWHLEQYIKVKEKLSNDVSAQRLQSLQIKFETEQTEKEKEIYRLQNVELAHMNTELKRLSDSLAQQANEDALTGLFNRRRLEQEFEKEFSRARRVEGKLTVMICDIDNFKQVNDRFSHQVGDQVLIRVAAILKTSIRAIDVVARYGGEEFVALFPDTATPDAFYIANRLREAIEKSPWHEIHPELRVTLSLGLCDDTAVADGYAMIRQADDKLYEAKRSGKNRVCY
jgi:diguanylate cyclase (GGDEF)-like protein